MRLGITLAEGSSPFAWLYFVISQVKDSHLPIVPVTYGVIPSLHGTSLQCWLLEVTPVAQCCRSACQGMMPRARVQTAGSSGQGRKAAPSVFCKSFMARYSCTNSFRAPKVGVFWKTETLVLRSFLSYCNTTLTVAILSYFFSPQCLAGQKLFFSEQCMVVFSAASAFLELLS